jgi:hypothetical protein
VIEWAIQIRERVVRSIDIEDVEAKRHAWAHAPHPKKKERTSALDKHSRDGMFHTNPWGKQYVTYKCKPGEILAIGKPLRATGDLGVEKALQAGYITDLVKDAFVQPYIVGSARACFVKSAHMDKICQELKRLMFPEMDIEFVYHSDDSCVTFRCRDGNITMNLDISKCDGSNFDPVFETLRWIMNHPVWQADLGACFDALKLPFRVKDPHNPHRWVEYRTVTDLHALSRLQELFPDVDVPDEVLKLQNYTLYSGTVLTTLINNVANMLIFLSFVEGFSADMTRSEVISKIPEWAERAGFIVRVDVCDGFWDLQFLKCTPVDSDCSAVAVNLGTWLKGFGRCHGDLPGTKEQALDTRARIYNSSLVVGRQHWGTCDFTRAFQHLIQGVSCKVEDKLYEALSAVEHSDEVWIRRYRVPEALYREAVAYIRDSEVGVALAHPVYDAIMAKDYGYEGEITDFESALPNTYIF